MADTKISNMTAASALDGTELIAGVQGGANVKITTLQQKTLSVGAGSVSIASGKTLTGNTSGTIGGGDAWVLNITAAKTVAFTHSLSFAGTDSTVMTFPTTSATIARTDAANSFTGNQTITSPSAAALVVGLAGTTNPAFTVDASTASQAAGFKITGAATGGTVALVATDSGSNTNVTFNAKGSGTIGIGSASTGAVTITPALTVAASGIAFTLSTTTAYSQLGNALVGAWPASSTIAFFGTTALDQTQTGNYAMIQTTGGQTNINAPTGQTVRLAINNATIVSVGAAVVTCTAPFTALSGTAIPAGGTAGSGLKLSSTANFGVFFGSGSPTLAAAKGSLYLRSDGSGVADRAYINTDGSTTWTAVATIG